MSPSPYELHSQLLEGGYTGDDVCMSLKHQRYNPFIPSARASHDCHVYPFTVPDILDAESSEGELLAFRVSLEVPRGALVLETDWIRKPQPFVCSLFI